MAIENIKGIAHVGFFVKDLERTRQFYCGILGFEEIFARSEEMENGRRVEISFLRAGDLTLEVICVPGLSYPADGCFQHLALRVENIEEAKQKLEDAGIETDELVYSAETFENGSKWVNFTGPDGEHLELNEVL